MTETFQIPSKKKYVVTTPGSKVKPPAGGGDSTKRTRRRKVSDKLKLAIQASQPKMVQVLLPNGKKRMQRVEE